MRHVLAEGLRLQGLLLELLYEAGHETVNISAGCLLDALRERERGRLGGRRTAGAGWSWKLASEERARVLATELASAALPHFIDGRCKKALFNESEGLCPCPPISVGA